jgi:hypothetical protein
LKETKEIRATLVDGGLLRYFPAGDESTEEVANEQKDKVRWLKDE